MNQSTREQVVALLRATRLLQAYNALKFRVLLARHAKANAAFLAEHPGEAFPPLDLAYDAYAHISLADYWASGRRHAEYFASLLARHLPPGPVRILEWGCGPARVIRHMPALFEGRAELTGTDYNPATIAWCRAHVPGIRFESNALEPPLPFSPGTFHAAYALSVFTHLSGAMHLAWRDELLRILKPGGVLVVTTHGACYRQRHLLPQERDQYDAGQLVVRGGVREGQKWFASFHPPAYVRSTLLKGFEILEHLESPLPNSIEQDVWVARKTSAGPGT